MPKNGGNVEDKNKKCDNCKNSAQPSVLSMQDSVLIVAAQIMKERPLWSTSFGDEELGGVMALRFLNRCEDRKKRKKIGLEDPVLEYLQ